MRAMRRGRLFVAGRHTLGHFDLPLRNCTIALDERIVVDAGVLQGELA